MTLRKQGRRTGGMFAPSDRVVPASEDMRNALRRMARGNNRTKRKVGMPSFKLRDEKEKHDG